MPFHIVRNDITTMACDAIVNAANSSLLGGGGVDGAIHRAAGPLLDEKCRKLGGCEVGDAKLTRGYDLPAKYVIHTVGPRWFGGGHGERDMLASCYRRSLEVAAQNGCETVAFPLISAGAYGFPRGEALRIATAEITAFLLDHDMTVYLVVFDRASFDLSGKLMSDVTEYVDQHYVDEHTDAERERRRFAAQSVAMMGAPLPSMPPQTEAKPKRKSPFRRRRDVAGAQDVSCESAPSDVSYDAEQPVMDAAAPSFELDESFSEMLLRKIDESGMTDSQCYKKANIDRKLFSKIRGDVHYRPSKPTVVAFAIALELGLDETRELLEKAGYALSHSIKFDVIIEYFIKNGRYNVFEINEVLFEFDQVLLGA